MINKIYNEDCVQGIKRIPTGSIDAILTDPPYRVTARGCAGNSGGMMQEKRCIQGKIFQHNDVLIKDYAGEFYRILKEGTHCYVMTNHKNLYEMLTEFQKVGFIFTKSLIWDKGNKIMGMFYMSQFEYILFFRKGKAKKINNCGTADILSVPNKKTKDENGKNIHDTEKPVELMEILINNSSQPNDLVFDPFMGVGTTALACMNTGRRFLGFELDKEYYDKSIERIHSERDLFTF